MKRFSSENNHSSNRSAGFWAGYCDLLTKKGVEANRLKCYEHWAVSFAKSFRGISLRSRTQEHVRAFLDNLKSNPSLQDWQIKQAEEAVRLLCDDYLQLGDGADASVRKDPIADPAASTTPPTPERPFPPRQPDGPWAAKVRTEMRLRHNSFRTEKSYLYWMRHYLRFHDQIGPSGVRS